MSEKRLRSRSGCLTCKNRRKKCDETRPTCHRCKRARMECLGYSHLDNPQPKPRKRRNNPSTLTASRPASNSSRESSDPLPTQAFAQSTPNAEPTQIAFAIDAQLLSENLSDSPADSDHLGSLDWLSEGLHDTANHSAIPATYGTHSSSGPTDFGTFGSAAHLDNALCEEACLYGGFSQFPDVNSAKFLSPEALGIPGNSPQELIAQESSQRELVLVKSAPLATPNGARSVFSYPTSRIQEDTEDDSDVEGVMSLISPGLALDRTASSNSLPFILSSHLRWIMKRFFEPLKVSQQKRDQLIKRYVSSADSRSTSMLVAIIMDSLDKSLVISSDNHFSLKALENCLNRKLVLAISSPATSPEAPANDVLEALEYFSETACIRCLTKPLSQSIKSVGEVALIYRKVCPEPPGSPIQLSAKLLHPNPALRLVPAVDILMSLMNGRPMHFQYDTTYTSETCQRVVDLNLTGLHWMNGVPDLFLILLARMNMLLEHSVPFVDPRIIQGLESEISSFEPILDGSPDPYLTVARLMVYESWRQIMYIYLYMGICGAASNDTRVEKAMKKMMRLLDGVRPGRMPDTFLLIPLCIAGVAAHKEQDRDTISKRLLGIRECAQMGTAGNDLVQKLNEIWTMCNVQRRYASWTDLRIATSRVTGII